MKGRVVVAGLVGGVLLFFWGFLSHAVLHFGDHGIDVLPKAPADQAFLDAVKSTAPESGMYMYPGMDPAMHDDPKAMEEWAERTKTEPHGVLVVTAEPYTGMGGYLAKEIVTDLVTALVAALVLAATLGCSRTYACRLGIMALLGLVTGFREVQLWNWFGFPCAYTWVQVLDGVLGFAFMGLGIAAIVKPKPGETTPAA